MTPAIAAYLNVLGLLLTTVAALVMWAFPPRMRYYTDKGEPVVTWTDVAYPSQVIKGRFQARLSKVGPVLLACGFALQLPNALIALP